MMNQIIHAIKAEEANEDQYTENGARVYKSTGNYLLDMNFKIASYRSMTEADIWRDFLKAWQDDLYKYLAIKWLFYVRDCREGLGEYRLFRVIFSILSNIEKNADNIKRLIDLVPVYGRWDDLLSVLEIGSKECQEHVLVLMKNQIDEDMKNMATKKPVSLLAKWLPSEGASNQCKRNLARKIAQAWKLSPKYYRTIRTALNKYLKTVEIDISAKNYRAIDYEHVPSKANVRYSKLFMKKDEQRRQAFLDAVEKGEKKINSSVNFPHDIVHMYGLENWGNGGWERIKKMGKIDKAIEALWMALPNYGLDNTLVVADGSGSMTSTVGNSNVTALEVANALAIYCSEHNSGVYKDKYITFSSRPKYVSFDAGDSLLKKLHTAGQHCECANTDIEKVFKLILQTAIDNNLTQNEMVKNILIISDMEFDQGSDHNSKKLFEIISDEYKARGYKLPRLVFWNVNSRTLGIPVTQNEQGVALVSGFSPAITKMVMSAQLDPFEALKEVLMSHRYKNVIWS